MSDRGLMHGKSVLVTGGTGGIGLATAIGLAELGARVGIVGRSATRAAAADDAVRSSKGSYDRDLARRLWKASAELTGSTEVAR